MPYVTLGTASQLQIQVPTVGSTNWGDTLRTQNFLLIAQHDHTGSGNGTQISTGALAADAVTGAKLRLDNNEYLRARNAADTANINIVRIGTTNHIELGAPFKNNTYITARDQADSADLNIWKIDGGDNLDFGTDISRLVMKNNTAIQSDNAGGTPTDMIKLDASDELVINPDVNKLVMKHDTYIQADNSGGTPTNLIKLDTNNDLAIDPEISKLLLKNSTYLTGRNNADSGDVNILRLNTSDKLEISPEISAVVKLSNNVALQHRNQADSAYISTVNLNTSDKIALGADLANAAIINNVALQHRNNADSAYIDTIKVNTSDIIEIGAEINSIQTNQVNAGATAVTLTDNTSVAASAGVITLSTDESCRIRYRIVRNGSTQEGVLSFTDADTIPAESYTGADCGVTFSVNAGALEYTTTSTGNNASMYYTILK